MDLFYFHSLLIYPSGGEWRIATQGVDQALELDLSFIMTDYWGQWDPSPSKQLPPTAN